MNEETVAYIRDIYTESSSNLLIVHENVVCDTSKCFTDKLDRY